MRKENREEQVKSVVHSPVKTGRPSTSATSPSKRTKPMETARNLTFDELDSDSDPIEDEVRPFNSATTPSVSVQAKSSDKQVVPAKNDDDDGLSPSAIYRMRDYVGELLEWVSTRVNPFLSNEERMVANTLYKNKMDVALMTMYIEKLRYFEVELPRGNLFP